MPPHADLTIPVKGRRPFRLEFLSAIVSRWLRYTLSGAVLWH